MNARRMFRPGWLSAVDNQYLYLADVQSIDQLPQGRFGQRSGSPQALPNLADIPAKVAPLSPAQPRNEVIEQVGPDRIVLMRHITLQGFFPTITTKHQLRVRGVGATLVGSVYASMDITINELVWRFNIEAVEQDSLQQITRVVGVFQRAA